MTNSISRIPLEADSAPLKEIVVGELNSLGRFSNPLSLHAQIGDLIEHDSDEERLSAAMDWAMQIRTECDLTWSQSIDVAMILLYG